MPPGSSSRRGSASRWSTSAPWPRWTGTASWRRSARPARRLSSTRKTSPDALAPRCRRSSPSTSSKTWTGLWCGWLGPTSPRCRSTLPRRSSSCPARRRSPRLCEPLPATKGSSPLRRRKAAPPPQQVGRRPLPHIEQGEYSLRREAVAAGMQAAGLDALCVFYPARVAYLTGFHHIPTERPRALIIGSSGEASLVVPAVEKEHAESATGVSQVRIYFEYPGAEHPMETVAEVLAEMNARPHRTGADHDGYVPFWGYRGPRLSDLVGAEPIDSELIVESLRRVKSKAELACIQLSCDWAVRGHRRMQGAIQVGKTEMECYTPPANETLFEMVREMPGWRPRGADDTGFIAMFVAGRSTAMPHGFVKGHGAPFLDRGDDAVLEPGMVFTVEPGVYIKDLGGFRHSDTVVITADGRRVMTDYPRELRELVIAV